jgi:hypothetical protein
MERPLRIFEMHEDADPVALAQSRLMPDLLAREYAATRVRCAIDLRAARSDDAAFWAFTMLPVGPLVSGVPPSLILSVHGMSACFEALPVLLQIRAVNAAWSDPPMPRARARARAAQRREQKRAAHKKERGIRRRERREWRSEEFRLREQQGLSSPGTEEYSSSSEEEEEGDWGRAPPRGGSLHPPRLEPRRRRWRRRLGWAQERLPPGNLRERRRAPQRRQRMPRRWLGVRRRPHGSGNNVRRALEEKEARVFHPEVGDYFPLIAFFSRLGLNSFTFVLAGWRPPCPLSRLPRC